MKLRTLLALTLVLAILASTAGAMTYRYTASAGLASLAFGLTAGLLPAALRIYLDWRRYGIW